MTLLMAWPIYINMDNLNLNMNVSEFITTNRTWNTQNLALFCSSHLLKLVCTIPLSQGGWLGQLVGGPLKLLYVSLHNMKSYRFLSIFKMCRLILLGFGLYGCLVGQNFLLEACLEPVAHLAKLF